MWKNPSFLLSKRSLEDIADLIDPCFLPQFLALHIVTDTDNHLQIFSCQAAKGTLFPDLSTYGDPRFAKYVVQGFYVLWSKCRPLWFRVVADLLYRRLYSSLFVHLKNPSPPFVICHIRHIFIITVLWLNSFSWIKCRNKFWFQFISGLWLVKKKKYG